MFTDSSVSYQQVLTKQPRSSLIAKQTQTTSIDVAEHGVNTQKQLSKEIQTAIFPFPLQKATKQEINHLDALIQQLRHYIIQSSGQRAQISEFIKNSKESGRSETEKINSVNVSALIPELECETALIHYVQGRLYVYGKARNGNSWKQWTIQPFYTQQRTTHVEQLNDCGWCGTAVESWANESGRPSMVIVCTKPSSIAMMRLGVQGSRLGSSGWLRSDFLAGEVVGSQFIRRTQAGSDYVIFSSVGRVLVIRLADGKLQVQSVALLKAKNAPSTARIAGQSQNANATTVGEQLTTASMFDVSGDGKLQIWCGSASGRLFQAEFAVDRPPQHSGDIGTSKVTWGMQVPPPVRRVMALSGELLTGQAAFIRKSLYQHVIVLDGLGALRLVRGRDTVVQYSGCFVDFALSGRFIVALDTSWTLKAFLIYRGIPIQLPDATTSLPSEIHPGSLQSGDASIRVVGTEVDRFVVLCTTGQRSIQVLVELQLPFDLGLTQDIGRLLFRAQH